MAKKPVKAAVIASAGEDKALTRVKVSRVIEVAGFRYKPGHDHMVDDVTLDALQTADAVADVQSAS